MRRIGALAVLALSAVAVPVRASAVERHDAMVPTSDGVRLAASVYLPAGTPGDADLPLVVRQHGGGSNKDNEYDVRYGTALLETGNFALLMYSHRGHGDSEGSFDFFGPRTTRDFSEVLDWVEATFGPRIDTGTVGVSGYSQGGGESLLPAASDARVKAVAVGQTFADLSEALNPNDCFKFSFATGIFLAAYKVPGARTDDALAVRWGASLYTDTEDVPTIPGQPSTTEDLRARSPVASVGSLVGRGVPVFWTQAWEDQLFPADHPPLVLEPLAEAGVPVHYWFSSGGHAAGGNFPAEEVARERAMLEWMDEFLRGADHGFGSGARPVVDYWRRTAPGKPGEWVAGTAPDWPHPAARPLRLYLDAGGRLAAEPSLAHFPVAEIHNDLASANLANDPIVSEIDNQGRARDFTGIGDTAARIPESENPIDTATFASDPLDAGVEVTGAPSLRLRATTTAARVAQIAAKVWDRAPDGSATLVSRGCRSVEDLAGGSLDRDISLWPNSHVFAQGHRIVLTVSAVDFPVFKPDTEPQRTSIFNTSSIELPRL